MRTRQQEICRLRKRVLTHHYKRAVDPQDNFTKEDLDNLHARIAYRASASRTPDVAESWLTKIFTLYRDHFKPETPTEKKEVGIMAYSLFDDNRTEFLSRDLNVELSLRPLSDLISPMIGHNSRPMYN